jgi:hypothetical protein
MFSGSGGEKRFSGLVFSTTSQVWENALAVDTMSLCVLRDVGLLTSHDRI